MVVLPPNADPACADWTVSTGVDRCALVDETTVNGDTDYVASALHLGDELCEYVGRRFRLGDELAAEVGHPAQPWIVNSCLAIDHPDVRGVR